MKKTYDEVLVLLFFVECFPAPREPKKTHMLCTVLPLQMAVKAFKPGSALTSDMLVNFLEQKTSPEPTVHLPEEQQIPNVYTQKETQKPAHKSFTKPHHVSMSNYYSALTIYEKHHVTNVFILAQLYLSC